MEIYVVKQGDTIDGIASEFNVPAAEIAFVNQISYPYPLVIGQALLIPVQDGLQQYKREVNVNGYAYPYINSKVLQTTLPYLTDLSVFSYGFSEEGDLIPPSQDDTGMINAALEFGTSPMLTLTPMDEYGRFNNNLISALVSSNSAQENLISQSLGMLGAKGFRGLDIDFEYIKAEDRDLFTSFVARMTRELNVYGYWVSVALAPKTSSDQRGLLYEGKDYGGLGAAANSCLLMTYEWGYKYSEPMAVAPINKVRQVVEYAVTQIPRNKLDLGIPNYGYDWPLPYVQGETAATTIGNIEAVEIAAANGAQIFFDETAQSPYFNYVADGIRHEVWFEDVRSMNAKFSLFEEFGLRGMGYWQIMRLFLANWVLLESRFNIIKD